MEVKNYNFRIELIPRAVMCNYVLFCYVVTLQVVVTLENIKNTSSLFKFTCIEIPDV